ncbi:hypothetical protein M9H77_16052 [Catharanthus roseus]|uniref:Uncharacterized protein n=1 Tax=Catharanthus roseus TaxID=4058 RepID=A0ACC0B022_CATRO|nr:hypothetical protein M9H77_16052 [Catharanthus roseus]
MDHYEDYVQEISFLRRSAEWQNSLKNFTQSSDKFQKISPRWAKLLAKFRRSRRNYAIGVCNHGHAQTAKLTEEQLIQTEQFRKSHVQPYNILRFFREQNVDCAISAQKIYNVVVKIKKNRMQGRNTVEEVLCLSAQRDYTVFYRNCDDSKVLSDIIVAYSTSIEIMRTLTYVLIMDMTYKTNK